MYRKTIGLIAIVLCAVAAGPYPKMAPLDRYLMSPSAEIALARTAAPPSVSANATVLVLGRTGYSTAVHGTNDFTCMVERAWTSNYHDPGFWNPRQRAPICYNGAGARTYMQIMIMRTNLILAGKSVDAAFAATSAALASGKLRPYEMGAMCYMMSKQQYLNDQGKAWHPHLMFFLPLKSQWGADLPGSPIFSSDDTQDHVTIFMVPVKHWSDGTPAM